MNTNSDIMEVTTNWYHFTTEYEHQQLIADLNSEYALVIVGGVAKIVYRVKHHNERDTFHYMTINAFKQLLSNTRIEIDGVTMTHAQWWLDHPQRQTYKHGVTFSPYRRVSEGVLNLWIDPAKEVKEVSMVT
jgi:hypothetical protein